MGALEGQKEDIEGNALYDRQPMQDRCYTIRGFRMDNKTYSNDMVPPKI